MRIPLSIVHYLADAERSSYVRLAPATRIDAYDPTLLRYLVAFAREVEAGASTVVPRPCGAESFSLARDGRSAPGFNPRPMKV